jgi:hypothetical protein
LNLEPAQLDAICLLPEIHDDFVQTPAGESVVLYPLGVEVDLAARGWELTLLNDPQGGIATVTSDGAVKFTPNLDFVGAATIHFLIEDQQHNDSSATLTVEVQNHFAFNAGKPADNGTAGAATRFDNSGSETGILALKVFSVVADPLFAGTAAPGAELVGRIYNQCGALAGESMLTADVDGRWQMCFAGTQALEFYRVEFELVAGQGSTSGKIALHPNESAWQSV